MTSVYFYMLRNILYYDFQPKLYYSYIGILMINIPEGTQLLAPFIITFYYFIPEDCGMFLGPSLPRPPWF